MTGSGLLSDLEMLLARCLGLCVLAGLRVVSAFKHELETRLAFGRGAFL